MEITQTYYPHNLTEWHRWLEDHHQTSQEIWLVHYKIGTNQPTIPYEEAVQEALCFGWIDGIKQRLDEERYVQKYTPRNQSTKWSESNLNRVKKLMAEGRMTPSGLEKLGKKIHELDQPDIKPAHTFVIPPELEEEIKKDPLAWENYSRMSLSNRRNYLRWVSDAKREETRQKRMKEVLEKLERNEPLGLK
jgi:uncharacterized protein YdeI (YjbR/CyaY-like superfamily)